MRSLLSTWALGLALLASACGGGNSTGVVNGTSFVKDQIANTDDRDDPVDVNAFEFSFPEDTAPFEDLFQ